MSGATQGPADNRLVIGGVVCDTPRRAVSPAGVPIVRFTLEHHSRQVEAGMERTARCRLAVVAAGDALAKVTERLAAGAPVRVWGFLTRADYRSGEARLVLHAERIERFGTDGFA